MSSISLAVLMTACADPGHLQPPPPDVRTLEMQARLERQRACEAHYRRVELTHPGRASVYPAGISIKEFCRRYR